MRLYLPRFYVRDLAANLTAMRRDVASAADAGCDWVVFPEQFLTGYRGEGEPAELRQEFVELSSAHPEVLCLFGTISEDGVNRQYWYRGGEAIAHYDKIHLFLPNKEDELWRPGSRYVALKHGQWRIGLATCNDVRFPEQARALKLKHDINLLVYPGLWPWARDHVWAALLRARAIENGCFVVGSCVAGVDNGLERFDGAGNYVFDPLGEQLHAEDRLYTLDAARLQQVTVDTRAQYCEVDQIELKGDSED